MFFFRYNRVLTESAGIINTTPLPEAYAVKVTPETGIMAPVIQDSKKHSGRSGILPYPDLSIRKNCTESISWVKMVWVPIHPQHPVFCPQNPSMTVRKKWLVFPGSPDEENSSQVPDHDAIGLRRMKNQVPVILNEVERLGACDQTRS